MTRYTAQDLSDMVNDPAPFPRRMSDDDAQEIRRMLEDRIEAVCDSLAPGWKRRGNTGYLTPKSAKDFGSFTVSLRDGRMPRGCWHRFSQAVGGGSVELVSYLLSGRKDDYRSAFSWARDFLGIQREELPEEEQRQRNERRAADAAEAERKRAIQVDREKARVAARVETAQSIWGESVPLGGSHGDAYLQARGLPPVSEWPWSPDGTIQFHPNLVSELDPRAGAFPAIVCKVVDAFGGHTSTWQIFLDRGAPTKAPLGNPKVGRGPAAGGAVRVGGDAEDVGGAEGLESALGAYFLENCRRPVWAFLSTSGMTSFEPPMFLKKVRLYTDADRGIIEKRTGHILDPPGFKAGVTLRGRLHSSGLECLIQPGHVHGDPLDLYITKKQYEARIREHS